MAIGLRIPGHGNVYSPTARFERRVIGRYLSGLTWVDFDVQAYNNVHLKTRYIGDYYDAGPGYEVGVWSITASLESARFYSYGQITSFVYFEIKTSFTTTGSSKVGGSVTGAGRYDDGTAIKVVAKPNSGFVVTRLDGYEGPLPTKNSAEVAVTVNADQAYVANFQKVYDVIYNANGGDETTVPLDTAPHFYNSGTAEDNITISSVVPIRTGWTFLGWSKTPDGGVDYIPGRTYANLTSGDSITLYAVWTRYELSFDTTGGEPQIETLLGAQGDGVKLPSAKDVEKYGYVLSGWRIDDEFYKPGATYHLPAENKVAIAEWRRPTVYITNPSPDKATLSLYRNSVTLSNVLAEEENGVLMADVDDGMSLVIVCTNKDKLYECVGLGLTEGAVEFNSEIDGDGGATIRFVLSSSYEGVVSYRKRKTFSLGIELHVLDKFGIEIPTPEGFSAAVVSPEPDEVVDGVARYLIGRTVTVEGTAESGYAMTLARVGGDEYAGIKDNRFTIPSINANAIANCYFTKLTYTLRGKVDEASASAIGAVVIDGGLAQEATYGDEVEYRAELRPESEARFDGWYDGETRVSSDQTYRHVVTGDVTLVAKAKVSVSLGIAYEDSGYSESCSLRLNGEAYSLGEKIDVTLGESFDFELILGSLVLGGEELWKFDSWFETQDDYRLNPLAYGVTETVYPTKNVDWTAVVTSKLKLKTLIVNLKNDETEGAIIAEGAISTYPEADEFSFDPLTGAYTFVFSGSKQVRLGSRDSVVVGGEDLAFSGFRDSGVVYQETQYTFFMTAAEKSITALYGSTGTRKITLAYGSHGGIVGNRTMGTFAIVETDDEEGVIGDDSISAEIHRGKRLTIVATPKNGYKFGGWFTSRELGGNPYLVNTTSTLVVLTDRVLYAWFVQDSNAVYEWEGSDANKSLEWRSKTYSSSRPFNPACCRVDSCGYPLIELDVDLFSAPNERPTSKTALMNVGSQEARRLPKRRPERYLQVCVKNDREVDSIVVGMSMMELAR